MLGIVLFGSVVFLLVTWQNIDAVLYAVLGAAAGWAHRAGPSIDSKRQNAYQSAESGKY